MKRTGLFSLISGFWLLVSGFYTNTHAQDETLEIITYYPAPYGVYNRLQIGSNPANGILLEPSDVSPNAGYIRFGDNTGWRLHLGRYSESAGGAANTGTTGVLMTVQDNGNVGIGITNPTNKIHVVGRNDTTDNIVFMPGTNTAAAGIPNIKVGVGTNNPGSDKLDIVTTVNSLNDLDSDIPMLIRRSNNTNNTGTGIGFACTTVTGTVGAKIIHERKGDYSQGDLVFYTKSDSNQTSLDERMRIDQDGDVTFRNMPGIASNNSFSLTVNPLGSTWTIYGQMTINIPSSGYILVESFGDMLCFNSGSNMDVWVGITDSPTGIPSGGAVRRIFNAQPPSYNIRTPYAVGRMYTVDTVGSKTFYIRAKRDVVTGRVDIAGSIHAIYFPVEYNP